jgi:acyl-CoA synthetase (AMP-forming)/AMP-acid ligase II
MEMSPKNPLFLWLVANDNLGVKTVNSRNQRLKLRRTATRFDEECRSWTWNNTLKKSLRENNKSQSHTGLFTESLKKENEGVCAKS